MARGRASHDGSGGHSDRPALREHPAGLRPDRSRTAATLVGRPPTQRLNQHADELGLELRRASDLRRAGTPQRPTHPAAMHPLRPRPPACAVGEPRARYLGERSFPLILQNAHRYFLYLALPFIGFLSIDVWRALWFPAPTGGTTLGIGVGTLVLAMNVVLLGGYTLGCHSLRHLVGGSLDRLAGRPVRSACYTCVGFLRSEEHTSELQSPDHLVCRLLLEKKKKRRNHIR